jgi:nucleoside-diphosphate-sugar epimerase
VNILLTGATGFIGNHLRTEFADKHHLFALTRHDDFTDNENLTWIKADLRQPATRLVVPGRVDAVVCLAQSKAYREFPAQAWDLFNVNISSVLTLLEYARQNEVKMFIFASSANVYKPQQEKISERSSPIPTSFYARSKRMAEMLIESYADYFRCLSLRLFTVYGPGQTGMLIPSLIERVRTEEPIQVQGKSGLKLTPIYITDVCRVIQTTLEMEESAPGFEVFNVGGDEQLGIRQIGLNIGEALQKQPRFEMVEGDEPGGWMADNDKLKTRFHIDKLVPFAEGIRRTIYE